VIFRLWQPFPEKVSGMQIGSNSLLIAAQHARTAQPAAKPQAAFEPLPLKQAAAPQTAAAQPSAAPQRPGSQLDIRV
jgi:hypothetical protein